MIGHIGFQVSSLFNTPDTDHKSNFNKCTILNLWRLDGDSRTNEDGNFSIYLPIFVSISFSGQKFATIMQHCRTTTIYDTVDNKTNHSFVIVIRVPSFCMHEKVMLY